jgi:hypothetical protein
MSRITRLLLGLLAVGLAATAVFAAAAALAGPRATAAAAHHPVVGIGDDKADMFGDPRFVALRIRTVRYDMSWDALSVASQRREATAWMDAAKHDGLNVLVTIDHSDRVIYRKVKVHGKTRRKAFSQTRVLPSTAQYIKAFREFRSRFPWVKAFVTWDESNCYCEVSYNKETQIAAFYRGMRAACSSCTILAAEFLDTPARYAVAMKTWISKFDRALGYQPGYWGLNDYEDANHLVTTQTRLLLRLVRGNIWLAETGGIVNRHNGTKDPGFPQNATHAAKVDSFILNKIAGLSPRIQRVYLYEWDAKTRRDSWDSALISYNNIPRPGYDVVARTLKSWGIAPNCSISLVPPACAEVASSPTGATGATGAKG